MSTLIIFFLSLAPLASDVAVQHPKAEMAKSMVKTAIFNSNDT
jgi:hypothetical protein